MEVISFNLAKMLTAKRIEMVESKDFADKFLSYVDTWERAKSVDITNPQVLKAIQYIYGEGAIDDIKNDGTKYDKGKKEILGLYTLLCRHLSSKSHREIASFMGIDYTTVYKNYGWYMVRLYKDSAIRNRHDSVIHYLVEHNKYAI